jgi:hypothetical protein
MEEAAAIRNKKVPLPTEAEMRRIMDKLCEELKPLFQHKIDTGIAEHNAFAAELYSRGEDNFRSAAKRAMCLKNPEPMPIFGRAGVVNTTPVFDTHIAVHP